MYNNAELESTYSERAREIWVARTARSSRPSGLQPRRTDVGDGRGRTSVLVLTEELENKIQTALALGCGYRSGLQDVEKRKRQISMQQADNTGTLASIKHRLDVKRLEIKLNKELTESQKKILEKLAQDVERLKVNQTISERNLATLDRNLACSLDRWRKAWTDVDKTLVKVWKDTGRLMPDGDSDGDDGKQTRNSGSKDKEEYKGDQPSDYGVDDIPSALPELDPGRQKRAERQRSEVLDWRHSVESSSQGSMVDAQNPGNRPLAKRASMHNSRPTRRRHQGEGKDDFLNRLGDLVPGICDQRSTPQPSAPRKHRTSYNSRQAHQNQRANRPKGEPPSPVISQHSSMLPPPSIESRHSLQNGRDRLGRYQERRRDIRSRSPRRGRRSSPNAPRYRDCESHEIKQSRARDESSRARGRCDCPEDDQGRCI